ncbi:MAG TPA: DUF3418 domain-containing protein, partial [Candidatus Binatia bacterium]|nr:DUF3418 domain-containing protein [Candidatus Binatia bacterium]
RQVMVFPGSALFDRNERQSKRIAAGKDKLPAKPASTHQPQWMVAGEMVETSKLFARTVAGIDPLWIVQLAPHLCKVTHQNPRWIVTAGNVMVDEIITFHGLEVSRRKVAYGNVNPQEATEIFIRSALVEEDLLPASRRREGDETDSGNDDVRILRHTGPKPPPLPPQYVFLEHNRQVRQKIETWQTRVRRHDLGSLDDKLFEFYAQRVGAPGTVPARIDVKHQLAGSEAGAPMATKPRLVSSVHELNRLIRDCGGPDFLFASEADLTGGVALSFDSESFPDAVPLGGQPVELAYAYSPGEEQDGVTVKLGFSLAQTVSQSCVEWSVPGLREGLVNELLRALPKSIRRELQPFPPKIVEIVRELQPAGDSLQADLAQFIQRRYGVEIPENAWPLDAIPAHLRPRIEVIGNDAKSLGASRDLAALRQKLEQVQARPAPDNSVWARVAQKWERTGITAWDFGDLPARITVSENGPVPVYAWPGFSVDENGHESGAPASSRRLETATTRRQDAGAPSVSLRLFRSEELARRASLGGIQKLVELALSKDFAWLHRDLRGLNRFDALVANFCPLAELQEQAYENLKRHVLPAEVFPGLTLADFAAAVEQTRLQIPGLATQLVDQVGAILRARKEIQQRCGATPMLPAGKSKTLTDLSELSFATKDAPQPTSIWAEELEALVPRNFLETIPFTQLTHIPRYLKALATRMERAKLNPVKDKERVQLLAPYRETLRKFAENPPASAGAQKQLEVFRWMLEEYKVSLFAQELGTAYPVSPKRLDEQIQRL